MRSQRSSLRINHAERRFLGVCAGLADYFDIPVLLVRVIFIIGVLTWPTLIIGYFILWFMLEKKVVPEDLTSALNESGPVEHFRNLDYRRPLYRNMRNKCIAGVCSGIAEYLEINTTLVRALAVFSIFVLGPYALLAYAIGWIVMEPNPAPRFNRPHGRAYRHRYRTKKRRHRRGKRRFAASRLSTTDDGEDIYEGGDDLYEGGDGSDDPLYEPRSRKRRNGRSYSNTNHNGVDADCQTDRESLERCAETFYALETRMRELEAFITSKKFRLHCEINRI